MFLQGNRAGETHGHARYGATGKASAEYKCWNNIVQRCHNPKVPNYPWYGGRGITVCERWRTSFENFLADMGERPPGTSIDRIDNSRGYEPGNCRWVTSGLQGENRSNTKLDASKVRQIRWLAELGYGKSAIARMYGVCASIVSGIVAGTRWRHV